jgi:hypothetical protein
MKIRVNTRLANSKISWIEIQFASSKLTAAMRESSSGCKDDKDTPVCSKQPRKQRQRKKNTSASIRVGNSTKKGKSWYLPPARADILLSRSVTACSRWMRSLLASERAFSAFFALANANLVDFSAVVWQQWRHPSSASRDKMQALATAKASTTQKKGKESRINKQRKALETSKTQKEDYPEKL